MLLTLAKGTYYPEDEERHNYIKEKFERELVARLRAGSDLIANEEEFAPKVEESKFGERLLGKYLNPVARRFRR
ncbi:hypothetical protein TELCIR_03278 [Teladorsagia circumcincta]|uniref:Uncharacterized protein n=1 Tax=Teladorsagia circumcincta TaxID=45464 RepID=A0A2G9UWS0_TELCI|nr:hypothetical protein TELCIR_03278 [Teladorsagia circumcincta]